MSDEYEYGPWAGWNGGGCPVAPSTLVQRAYHGPVEASEPREAGEFLWLNEPGSYPIVAYRIAAPKPKRELVVGKWYWMGGGWMLCIHSEGDFGWMRRSPNNDAYRNHVSQVDWSTPPRDEAPE